MERTTTATGYRCGVYPTISRKFAGCGRTVASRHQSLTQSSIGSNGQHIGRQVGGQAAVDNAIQKVNDTERSSNLSGGAYIGHDSDVAGRSPGRGMATNDQRGPERYPGRFEIQISTTPETDEAHGEKQVYMPDSALQAEYVFIKRGKPDNLGKQFDGPFKVEEQVGDTCLKIRLGSMAQGEPRFETHLWNNMKPVVVQESTKVQERPNPGRKKEKRRFGRRNQRTRKSE